MGGSYTTVVYTEIHMNFLCQSKSHCALTNQDNKQHRSNKCPYRTTSCRKPTAENKGENWKHQQVFMVCLRLTVKIEI